MDSGAMLKAIFERGEKEMQTSITNLLLLPVNYSINEHMKQVERLLKDHPVFSRLYQLEKAIQPTLINIEEQGLVVSKDWFTAGLLEKINQLTQAGRKVNDLIGSPNENVVEKLALKRFWEDNSLPIATTFDSLKRYQHLHPTYQLMNEYKNHQSYLKMWDERVQEKGTVVKDGVLIKGSWNSFSSYTGRMTAGDLPLTSMPITMRDYIVSPSGYQTYSLDFSNIELRLLAYYARCSLLLKQFNQGVDVHDETAKLIRQSLDDQTLTERQARQLAKQFTFSLLYGAGTQTITKNMQKSCLDVRNADVFTLTNVFYEKYPELLRFLLERGEDEQLLTAFGKVKPAASFSQPQRKNFALQSSVSVAIKVLVEILAKHGIRVAHIIHDEVWIEIEKNQDLDCHLKEAISEFRNKTEKIFPGFPIEGLFSKEKIGGKENDPDQ